MSRSISRTYRGLQAVWTRAFSLGVAATVALGLLGCQPEAATSTVETAPPTGDVLGLPVEVARKDPTLIPVGETGKLEVSVTPLRDLEGLRLELTGDKGLEILSRPTSFDVGSRFMGETFTEIVEVRPSREGLLHLKVLVKGLRDGKALGRTGVVAVLTSEGAHRAALETPGKVIVDPSGRRILEIPVDNDEAPDDRR